ETIAKSLENILKEIEEEEYTLLEAFQQEVVWWSSLDRKVSLFGPIFIILISALSGFGAIISLKHYQGQQERDQKDLREARDRLASIIKGSSLGAWEWNILDNSTEINDICAEMLGYTRAEFEPVSFDSFRHFIHPEDVAQSKKLLDEHLAGKSEIYNCTMRIRHKEGHWVWILDRGQVIIRNKQGNPLVMCGTFDDITAQKQMEKQLFYEKTLFETTLLSVGDGVISTDETGTIRFMNKVAEQLTGWQADEARGLPFGDVFKILCGKDRQPCLDPVKQVLEKGKPVELDDDTILIARDGDERFINDSAAPILSATQTITGVVLVFRDSTAKKKRQEEIHTLSITDPLTTLPNRRYYEQAKQEMNKEPFYPLALVLADVNGLKLTNDAFGHEVGDELLRKVSRIMRETCREGDIISRVGGDEFVLLLPQTDALHAEVIVKRINDALKKEKIKGIQLSVSFGYAVKELGKERYEDTFKIAEDAMYRSKLNESLSFKKQVIKTLLSKLFEQEKGAEEHSKLVASLSAAFAEVLGYRGDEIKNFKLAGMYHDLGKIGITPSILTTPKEALSHTQVLELQRHVEIGYNILRSVGEYASFAEAILHHHEKWDGSGYPQKLAHEAIPLSAQILAIANIYADQRASKSKEEAIAYLNDHRNSWFNPELVDTFITKVLLA
ncbi:MAG: diguanylate cyclase domain-containing protein, partial [Sphaerochaetaceae bacterium]